jgi:hypothetical protein
MNDGTKSIERSVYIAAVLYKRERKERLIAALKMITKTAKRKEYKNKRRRLFCSCCFCCRISHTHTHTHGRR